VGGSRPGSVSFGGRLGGILTQRISVPRVVFITHQLLTPSNVKQHYGRELRAGKQSQKHGSVSESVME
jgi:hypothetical protein